MFKYKVIIERIEEDKNVYITENFPEKAEFVINGDASAAEMLEGFINLMEVMTWNMEDYKACFDKYVEMVEDKIHIN